MLRYHGGASKYPRRVEALDTADPGDNWGEGPWGERLSAMHPREP
jgi:hypothetical protein